MTDIILRGKQAAFVDAYIANELLEPEQRVSQTQIAINAGINPRSAAGYASAALTHPQVLAAISARKRDLAEAAAGAVDVDKARVLREWAEIAIADPTEVVSVRRINCRHCYGVQFRYQRTDAEYADETAQELEDASFAGRDAKLDKFVGGPGFRKVRPPNPECPECSGEGVEDVHVRDFRKLSPKVRRLIAGVKTTRDGMEVKFRDQDAALRNLAQWLGLLVDRKEHSGPNGGPVPVAQVSYSLPSDPQEASRAWQLLMEGKA